MAIKRTITRRYGVRPVQMDVSSGGLALAQASQNVANTVSNVTKFIDDNQFQEAVLNAEIQGRRVGSQTITDDNGNIIPKPLDQMTLNSFTADIYNKSNIRKAQAYFKKEAINSYGLALQNHAISVSEKSLLENQGKVDESGSLVVEKASKSYIDSIKSTVAPEVFDVISPALGKIWGEANRKASALQLKEVKETTLFEAIKYSEKLLAMETNIIVNGTADPLEYEFIENEKARIFTIIEDNAKSKKDAMAFQLGYNQMLQQNVSSNAVDLAYQAGVSITDMLNMALDTGKSFANDENIDGAKIQQVMESRIAFYDKKDTEEREANRYASANILADLGVRLILNQPISESDVSKLLPADLLRYHKAKAAAQQTTNTKNVNDFNDGITTRLQNLEFGLIKPAEPMVMAIDELGDIETRESLKNKAKVVEMNELIRLLGHKDVKPNVRQKILSTIKKVHAENAQLTIDQFKAHMQKMFTGSGGVVAVDPDTLLSPSYIAILKNKGLIGPDKQLNAYSEEEWVKAVATYAKNWQKGINKTRLLSQVGTFISNRVKLPKDHKEELEKIMPKVLPSGAEINVLSDNEDIREESLEFVTNQALAFNYIPDYAKTLFESIESVNTPEAFTNIKRLYQSIKRGFVDQSGGNDSLFMWIAGENTSGINVNLMESAMFAPDADYFRNINQPKSANRNLADLIPSQKFYGGNQTEEEIFNNAFENLADKIDDNWFERFFSNDIGGVPYTTRVLQNFYQKSGVSNMAEAMFKEPIIKAELMKRVKFALSQGNVAKTPRGLENAMKTALFDLSGNLSLQEDGDGNVFLTRGVDIIKAAQSNVPDGLGFIVTREVIDNDVMNKFNQTFAMDETDTELKDAIDERRFMYISNNNRIGNPSYRVVAHTKDDRFVTIANDYVFNYEGSQLQSDFTKAKQLISNGGVRSVFGYFDFMSQNNIKAVMQSIDSNRNYTQSLASLFAGYNNLAQSLGLNGIKFEAVSNYLASDQGKKEVENFFDAYRLIRFDIR